MLQDLVTNMIGSKKRTVSITTIRGETFIEVRPFKVILPAILERQRMKAGLTIREVANRLGYSSHNNYAAYESDKIEPSFEKFQELLGGILREKNGAHATVAL